MSESAQRVPRLSAGVEIGPDRGNGEPVVVAAPVERFFRLSPAIARLLARIDGRRSIAELAGAGTDEIPAPTAEQLSNIVDRQLVPRGLVHFGLEPAPAPRARSALWLRVPLVPARWVGALAAALEPLFRAPVAALVIFLSLGAQVWFFARRPSAGTAAPLDSAGAAGAAGWFLLTVLLHEFGHAAALRSRGERPGVIGFGLYRVWPVMFSDVARAWRLAPRDRAVVDAGGIYVQLLAASALIAVWAATRGPALAAAIVMADVAIAFNFTPLLRWDGYWLLTDLAGLTNLERDSRAGLRSLVRGRGGAIPWPATLHAALGSLVHAAFLAWALLVVAPGAGRDMRAAWAQRAAGIDGRGFASPSLRLAIGATVLVAIVGALVAGVRAAFELLRPGAPGEGTTPAS